MPVGSRPDRWRMISKRRVSIGSMFAASTVGLCGISSRVLSKLRWEWWDQLTVGMAVIAAFLLALALFTDVFGVKQVGQTWMPRAFDRVVSIPSSHPTTQLTR